MTAVTCHFLSFRHAMDSRNVSSHTMNTVVAAASSADTRIYVRL